MKKLIALFCVASAVTAFADTPAASDNVFGVLRVDIGENTKEAIIAVPWLDPGTGKPIKVTDVIKTANLAGGTQLFYYNTGTKLYQVWQLSDSKQWEAAQDPTNLDPEQKLVRGNAILLKAATNGTLPSSVYLYGQVPTTSETTIQMAVATSGTPAAYTLLAPPTVSDCDVSTAEWANVGKNDWLIIAGKAPFNYNEQKQKWGHFTVNDNFQKEWSYEGADAAVIPAGQGAWYVSRTVSANAPSVVWNNLPSTGSGN